MIKKYLLILILSLFAITANANTTFIFGAVTRSYFSSQQDEQRIHAYQNFVKALAKVTHFTIHFKAFHSKQELYDAMRAGKIDLAFHAYYDPCALNRGMLSYPLGIVLAKQNGHLVTSYDSYIITKSQNLTTLAALKNKSLGLQGDGLSLSGLIYPIAYLQQHNIDIHHYFSKILYFSGFQESLKALDTHAVDAIASWDAAAISNNKRARQYSIVATIPNLPNPAIVAGLQVTAKDRAALTRGLLALKPAAFKGLSFVSVAPYQTGFYDAAIATIKNVLPLIPQKYCAS